MRIYRFEAKMADLMNVSTIGGRMAPPSATSATDAALGLRPSRALSSAQLSAEWTTSNPLRNDSSLNSFYPLNFVSHNMGAVHSQGPTPAIPPIPSYSSHFGVGLSIKAFSDLCPNCFAVLRVSVPPWWVFRFAFPISVICVNQ